MAMGELRRVLEKDLRGDRAEMTVITISLEVVSFWLKRLGFLSVKR